MAAKKKAKRAPVKKKAAAKTTKKAAKKTTKKAAKKTRAKKTSDPAEANLSKIHEEAQASSDGMPWDDGPLSAEAVAMVREEADEADEEAEEWDRAPSFPLDDVIKRASRFVDVKQNPYVQLYPNVVVGAGPRGTVVVPMEAPGIPAHGLTVNAPKLIRMLKSAGTSAELSGSPDRLTIKYAGGRFSIQALPHTVPMPSFPAIDSGAYSALNPALFQTAAAFAGDPKKIEPAMFGGVFIGRGMVSATDRHSFFHAVSQNQLATSSIIPKDAFDDIHEEVWVAIDDKGLLYIAVPSTGEYRMVVPFGGEWPDVRAVLDANQHVFTVSVPRVEIEAALKRMVIVQKRTSSVMMHIFADGQGVWHMEMRAADPTGQNEYVTRIALQDVRGQVGLDEQNRFKTFVSIENLRRLVFLSPNPTVTELSFGANGARDPVGVETAAYRALVVVMHPVG